MDYEKAYKKAIEQARKELKTCGSMDCDAARQIFRFFPELRESEDERNIDTIFNCLYQCCDTGFISGTQRDNALAYLEKQKEQKPTLNWRTIEQATTKRTDEGDCVTTEKMLIKGLIDDEDYDIIDKDVMVNKNLLCIPVSELNAKEQKPVEWSEEDEEIFNNIIEKAKGGHWIEVNEITWLINRFKSLRPSWKPSEEHLSALLAIFNDPDNIGSQTCQLALTDLYEQLKAL